MLLIPVRRQGAFRPALAASLALAGFALLAPPAPASTNVVWPVLHGEVGKLFTLNLAQADEVPREWTNVTYYMLGAAHQGRFVAGIEQLQFSNATGRLQWTPEPAQAGRYECMFVASPASNTLIAIRRVIDIEAPPLTTDTSPLGKQLTEWWKAGTAAGLVGVAYDNRDGGHSMFNTNAFPQLTFIQYPPEYKQRGLNLGAQIGLLFNYITVGNCSMAGPAEAGGCLVRTLLLDRRTGEVLATQYRRNHVYMYPEHLDCNPGHNGLGGGGYGDLLPANTPYTVLSQGSSGSDQPFINAWFAALASFRPEVRRVLADQGLLMPALQMIFRMSNKNVLKPEDYLTARAHPTAFEGGNVDAPKMAELAHAMRLDSLPPLVQLRVVEEDRYGEGRDFFDPGGDEELFSTPGAIARVIHAMPYVRRMVVSAEDSYAVNAPIEAYKWVVLRGNAEQIRITPRNPEGSVVEIRVGYQPRRPVAPGAALESNRIELGAFAKTARAWSPPAFITFFTLDNEARTYAADGRLVDIGYDAGDALLGPADVRDWGAVAELVLSEKADGPAALLRRRWTADELAALREAARELQPAAAAAVTARQQRDTALTDATKEQTKKAADEADGKLAGLLTAARPKLGASFQAKVVAALNQLKDDPDLTLQNASALAALPEGEGKSGLAQERKRVVAMGIAKAQGDQLAWTPVRGGVDKLTAYERNRIEWFNLAALRALYPGLVARTFKANFVDQRLTIPKAWHDVYQYDATNRVVGWKRYTDSGVEQFTADGYLVTETDKLGRATKARLVTYARKQTGVLSLEMEKALGPTVQYQYASDQDLVGHIVR